MSAPRPKGWMCGRPTECDICAKPLKTEVVDGKMNRQAGGHWAYMCVPCHTLQGVGLGVGRGQRYKLVNGDWIKIQEDKNGEVKT